MLYNKFSAKIVRTNKKQDDASVSLDALIMIAFTMVVVESKKQYPCNMLLEHCGSNVDSMPPTTWNSESNLDRLTSPGMNFVPLALMGGRGRRGLESPREISRVQAMMTKGG